MQLGARAFARLSSVILWALAVVSLSVSVSWAEQSATGEKKSVAPISQAAPVAESERVRQLLSTMSQAVRGLDYQGLFTYEYGGALETLRIQHDVDQGAEYEYVQHLSGPSRKVYRQGRSVECLYPGDQLLQGGLLKIGGQLNGLQHHYKFALRGYERIADRRAAIVQVMPKDQYRYGYRLSIDLVSGLPLKSMLVNAKQQVLERFQFVELEVNPQSMNRVSIEAGQQGDVRLIDHRLTDCNHPQQVKSQRWRVSWLPSGFMLSGQRKVAGTERDMLMFTDGLTVFSVFVEPVDSPVMLAGSAHRGATVAYIHKLVSDDLHHRVTVVGEIPTVTAKRVASSVQSLL